LSLPTPRKRARNQKLYAVPIFAVSAANLQQKLFLKLKQLDARRLRQPVVTLKAYKTKEAIFWS
jgi:hypothetical protein